MARLIGRLRRRFGAVLTLLALPFALLGLFALEDDGGGEGEGGGEGGTGEGEGVGDDETNLSDAGKRALAREREARREADKTRKAAERRAAELEERLTKLEGDRKSDTEKELEKARKEADEAARKEERTKADQRIIRAEIRAVAAGKLHDPADALVHLDLDDFTVDDDGEVDRKAIDKALDELLRTKPYLGKEATKRPPGGADGGARQTNGSDDPGPGLARLRHAYATSGKKT